VEHAGHLADRNDDEGRFVGGESFSYCCTQSRSVLGLDSPRAESLGELDEVRVDQLGGDDPAAERLSLGSADVAIRAVIEHD
jgi:hypothetical protein